MKNKITVKTSGGATYIIETNETVVEIDGHKIVIGNLKPIVSAPPTEPIVGTTTVEYDPIDLVIASERWG